MSGYIGSKASVTQVDGYNRTEADSEFVQVTGDTMTGDLTITGTLDVDNVTDGTTSVPTGYVVNGPAKAWINFNGTGTIATRDSLNVSSLTDGGAGLYRQNFTSVMANTNYTVVSACNVYHSICSPASTVQMAIECFHVSGVGGERLFYDHTVVSGSAYGDLA